MSLSDLDPGVRELVAFLRANRFETTDSGDGVTKVEALTEGEALDYPHVVIVVEDSCNLVQEADRLLNVLIDAGVELDHGGIEASYDPLDGSSILLIQDVEDQWVRAFVAPVGDGEQVN